MNKPEMETIDKLFNALASFYGSRWITQFDRWMTESMYKNLWQSALTGCTYDEMRIALVLLKQAARHPSALPPSHLEFYRYAKGTAQPALYRAPVVVGRGDPAVARRALDEINAKLRYKKPVTT